MQIRETKLISPTNCLWHFFCFSNKIRNIWSFEICWTSIFMYSTIARLNSDKIIMFRILMNKRKRLSRKYFLAHFLQLLVSFLQLTTRHMHLLRIFLLLLLTTSFLLEACSSYLEHFRYTFKMKKSVSLTPSHSDLLNSSALPRKIFPGFPG